MASLGPRRGGLSVHAVNGEDSFSPRWLRFLDLAGGIAAARVAHAAAAPATAAETPATLDQAILTGPVAVDPPAAIFEALDFSRTGPTSDSLWRVITLSSPEAPRDAALSPGDSAPAGLLPPDGAPGPTAHVEEAPLLTGPPGPYLAWQPSTVAPDPLRDAPTSPESVPVPDDPDPAAGHLPKSEAVIWSGPAAMAFPADAQDTGDLPPAEASIDGALNPADLDPVLSSMASDHSILSGLGDGDLGVAFLPADSSDFGDLPLGLDVGGLFTPPPLPLPEMFWG